MPLELTVLRCPDAVPPEARNVPGGEFSVGRGPGVDWVLPDPERLLSKRHFVLAFRSGSWQLADTSTNGTFMNADAMALGAGDVRTLRDGDRVRLGAYEIEVRLTDEANQYGGGMQAGFGAGPRGGADPFGDPFGMDPLAPPAPAPVRQPYGDPAPTSRDMAPILPDDFDLMAPDPRGQRGGQSFQSSVQSDHSSAMQDAFQPPRPAGEMPLRSGGAIPTDDLLPDDWEADLLEGIDAPAAARPILPSARDVSAQPLPPPPPAPRFVPATPRAMPEPPAPPEALVEERSPFDEPSDVLGSGRLSSPVVAAAVASSARPPAPPASVFDEPRDTPPAPALRPPEAQREAAPSEPADAALLAAFLDGAGMHDLSLKDPIATMRGLGAAFRSMVSGLRNVLIARASIKSEFRIEQTMIRARGNNPLKFSAGDDDALAALLGSGRRVDMTPAAAIADALQDIRLHELASMAAMQSAIRALLSGLDPRKVRAAADQAGGLTVLPAQRKARAWDTFEALHTQTVQALSDDFDSVFGKAFARAYEQALEEISVKERQ